MAARLVRTSWWRGLRSRGKYGARWILCRVVSMNPAFWRRSAKFIIGQVGDANAKKGSWETGSGVSVFVRELARLPDDIRQSDIIRHLYDKGLLEEKDLNRYLQEMFSDRRFEPFDEIVDDESIGYGVVRKLHQIRISQFRSGGKWDAESIQRFYETVPADHYLKRSIFNALLEQVIREGRVQTLIELLSSLDTSALGYVKRPIFMGACRLLIKHGEKRVCREFLTRYLSVSPNYAYLYFLEPAREVNGDKEFDSYNNWMDVLTDLERLYPAVDSEDHRVFTEYAVNPLRKVWKWADQDFMDIRFDRERRDLLLEKLLQAIKERKPLSLIRLVDGEAYAYASPDVPRIEKEELRSDNRARERHWWGREIGSSTRYCIQRDVRDAAGRADILGIPSPYRIVRDLGQSRKPFGHTRQQRGLITVLNAISKGACTDVQIITEERCHLILFDAETLKRIGNQAERVVFVGCWSSEQLDFGLNKPVEHILVSPHSKVFHLAGDGSEPLYQSYPELGRRIEAVSGPGVLVLVSAGIIGKIFCEKARRAGAVALDIGAVSDELVGYKTRGVAH